MEKELAKAVYSFALQLYEKGYNGVCYMDNGYEGPIIPGMVNYLWSGKQPAHSIAQDGVALTIFMSRHPDGAPNYGIQLHPKFSEGKFMVDKISAFETDRNNNIVRLASLENTSLENIPGCPEMLLKLRHVPRRHPEGTAPRGGRVKFKKPVQKRGFKR